jgi:hypothetical protein
VSRQRAPAGPGADDDDVVVAHRDPSDQCSPVMRSPRSARPG